MKQKQNQINNITMIDILSYFKKNIIDGEEVLRLVKEHDKELSCMKLIPSDNESEDDGKYLVEKHCFKENSNVFSEMHPILLQTALLRNVVVYLTRQHFFRVTGRNYTYDVFEDVRGKYLSYEKIEKHLKYIEQPDFRILPANVAQAVIRSVMTEWKVYKELLKKKKNGEYDGYVGIPRYSDTKHDATYVAKYFKATLSKKHLAENIINIPKTNISIKTNIDPELIRSVNVSYSTGQCLVNVVYENKERIPAKQDNGIYLAIDPGLDNLFTIVSNCDYFRPFIIDGKEIKSINRYYNKKISTYTEMMKAKDESFASDEYTRKMWADRKNVLEDIAHLISARIIEIARIINANTIVIGHNDRWKDELPFKKPVKQNFAYIPYDTLYKKIEYKAAAYGITVVRQEESYTSKASFLDGDEIPTYVESDDTSYKFSGKRIKRGLYRASDGTIINADVNGACNILRKYLKVNSIDTDISGECMGAVIPPVRVRISELKNRKRLLNK